MKKSKNQSFKNLINSIVNKAVSDAVNETMNEFPTTIIEKNRLPDKLSNANKAVFRKDDFTFELAEVGVPYSKYELKRKFSNDRKPIKGTILIITKE